MKNLILIIAILMIASAVYAGEYAGIIKYKVGTVRIEDENGKLVDAKVNQKFTKTSTIRIGKNSSAKISLSNGKIYALKANSVVNISKLFKPAKKSANSGLLAKLSSLKNKLGQSGNAGLGSVSAVAGVRGSDVADTRQIRIKKAAELIWEE